MSQSYKCVLWASGAAPLATGAGSPGVSFCGGTCPPAGAGLCRCRHCGWQLAPADWPRGLQLSQRSTVWGLAPESFLQKGWLGGHLVWPEPASRCVGSRVLGGPRHGWGCLVGAAVLPKTGCCCVGLAALQGSLQRELLSGVWVREGWGGLRESPGPAKGGRQAKGEHEFVSTCAGQWGRRVAQRGSGARASSWVRFPALVPALTLDLGTRAPPLESLVPLQPLPLLGLQVGPSQGWASSSWHWCPALGALPGLGRPAPREGGGPLQPRHGCHMVWATPLWGLLWLLST